MLTAFGQARISGGAALVALAVTWVSVAPAAPEDAHAPSGSTSEKPQDQEQPAAPVTGTPAVEGPSPPVDAARDSGELLRAYHAALNARRLDAFGALSVEGLASSIESAERQLAQGRRDEAIFALAALVESPRFAPLRDLPEGRAAVFLLGDALGRAGAYRDALAYLERLLGTARVDSALRRAAASLVEFAIVSGEGEVFLAALDRLPKGPAQPWAGDLAFLRGLLHERAGRVQDALTQYAQVTAISRHWAQATYRAGLLEAERRAFAASEQHFCRIADPKQTPKAAPLFGGNEFFEIRDLARLGLGRVAHEQYRFDDARYYYHLVPGDSERLPEALYESATSRYEAKDYEAAHALLDELRALERPHPYADEAWILDAYVDLAQCEFPRADARLKEFLRRYEPVLAAARQLQGDPGALRKLLAGGAEDPSGLGFAPQVSELLATAIRMDPSYGSVTRRLRDVEHQLSGLSSARSNIAGLAQVIARPDAVRPRQSTPLADTPADRAKRLDEQLAALRRLLREAGRFDTARKTDMAAMKSEIAAIEADAQALRTNVLSAPGPTPDGAGGDALLELSSRDSALAVELERAAMQQRDALVRTQDELALESLSRVERRLTRLVRRARAGRIETVLGRKRAVEIEIEALSQGYLPRGAVDSLDAARYLRDDEEYWPFDGEDWDDEYVGGEGLR